MILLEKCIDLLKNNPLLREEAWEQIDKNPELEIASITNQLAGEFFELLNFSVLGGEYTVSSSAGIKLINQIKEQVDKIPSTLETIQNLKNREQSQFLLLGYLTPIRKSLRAYQHLLHQLEKKTAHDTMLFSGWRESKENSTLMEIDPSVKNLAEVFISNILIALSDHNLSVDQTQLKSLLLAKRKLEDITITPFYKAIILDKCEFLIRKINYRFQEDKKNFLYAFEFQDSKIDESKELKHFGLFNEKTRLHYGIGTEVSQKDWSHLYEKIIKDEVENFNDYHSILQFYKDRVKDRNRISNLKPIFNATCEKRFKETDSVFDHEAIFINKNYFINNEFSLLLSNEDATFHDALDQLNQIRTLQKETGVNNYFPYLKFCEFLCILIDKRISNLRLTEDEVKKYLSHLNRALEEAFKSFEWCKDSKFLSFQLPRAEAIIKHHHNGKSYDLFMASSFVLPINYVKVERDLKDIEKKIDSIKIILDVHKTISEEKSEIRRIKEEIEKIDRRSIEIIGIFAAIVLFTSGSIQIFSIKDVTIKDGLSWMLMFSYSLVLFVFLIWLITRDGLAIKSLSILHWLFLFGLLSMWALSLCYVFGWTPFS
jgi:hypothetical protein